MKQRDMNRIRNEMAEYQQKLIEKNKIDMAIAVDKVALIINEHEDNKDN